MNSGCLKCTENSFLCTICRHFGDLAKIRHVIAYNISPFEQRGLSETTFLRESQTFGEDSKHLYSRLHHSWFLPDPHMGQWCSRTDQKKDPRRLYENASLSNLFLFNKRKRLCEKRISDWLPINHVDSFYLFNKVP